MIGQFNQPQGIRPYRLGMGIGKVSGDTYRQAVLNTGPAAYWRLGETVLVSTVTNISVANPTHITTSAPHGIINGNTVVITASVGGTPNINGTYVATVLDATHFTIPVNVSVAGAGGSVRQDAYDELGLSPAVYQANTTIGVGGLLTGDSNAAISCAVNDSEGFRIVTTTMPDFGTLSGTIVAWVNLSSVASPGNYLAASHGSPDGTHAGWSIGNGFTAGHLKARISDGTHYVPADMVLGKTPVVGTTSMIAVVFDRAGTTHAYVDAIDSTSNSSLASVTGSVANAADLFLFTSVAGWLTQGVCDEGAIWNRALSATEVAMLYGIGHATW